MIKLANKISDETIEYVGILAKLELSEEEKEAAKKDMEQMLDYIDLIQQGLNQCLMYFRYRMCSVKMW